MVLVHARWMQAGAAEELRQANGAEVGRRAEEPGCSGAGGRGPLLTLEHHHLVLAHSVNSPHSTSHRSRSCARVLPLEEWLVWSRSFSDNQIHVGAAQSPGHRSGLEGERDKLGGEHMHVEPHLWAQPQQ